jgi:hypothetical protein
MDKVLVGVVSAADFERAQGCISELSSHRGYDDWLDSRYGRFMGLSLGGDDAHLVTVGLEAFLNWCEGRGLRPSESTLDAFALYSMRGVDAHPVMDNSAPSLRPPVRLTAPKPRSSSRARGPKSASRSVGADL